ncbi:MAG: hypothetical protein ACTSXZ_10090 [Alphaproteobacteria bacterium]
MKKAPLHFGLILAGVVAAGSAAADPYGSWRTYSSDDDRLSISDSFNRETSVSKTYSEDNDIWSSKSSSEDNDVSVSKTHSEDNDVDIRKSHSEDNDYWSRHSEDNDIAIRKSHSEDNDVTTTITEDNDITKSWQQSTDLDFQIATPTMTSYKYQDQDAGHQADTQVYGSASGHSVGVEGGTNLVSAGNDETVYYGPALVNTNTNQLPQNNLFIQGSNTGAPISQANTFAGRDMGPKGVFAPIGNTSAQVGGNVGNQSGASVDQSGDSANSIADPMSSVIRR